MAAKSKSNIKNLNAPKKVTWLVAFLTALAGLIVGIIDLINPGGWTGVASFILLVVSSGLMLLSSYVKGL